MNSDRTELERLTKQIQAQVGTSLHQDFQRLLDCLLEEAKERMVECQLASDLQRYQVAAQVYRKLIKKMTAPVPFQKP